jgi:hypothetical protein
VPAQAEPVPGEVGDRLAGRAHLVLVPAAGRVRDPAGADRVVPEQVVEQVVPEDHTPAVGDAGRVALQHRDLVGRVGQLGEHREVEAGGPAADAGDPHGFS